jgi:hypothetical protein
MVGVAAASVETDGAATKATGLALHSTELISLIDDEIAPRVLAEWKVDPESLGL